VRLLGALVLLGVAAELWVRRGLVVGIVAVVVCGGIGLSPLLAQGQTADWSRRHPVLSSSFVIPPMMFFFLALSTGLGTLLCLLVGVIAGAALVALRPFLTGIRRDNP
jgi:hypothetical protein